MSDTLERTRARSGSLVMQNQADLDEHPSRPLLESQNSVPGPQRDSGGAKRDKLRDDSSSEGQGFDQVSVKITRKPTYKEQKRMYKEEKKRLTDEILLCLSESTFLIESGWLKARTTIKTWTKIWCELKPGGMVLYKNERVNETSTWIGTILLNVCRVIERPSKKEGFCFKIYHPLDQNIWTNKGPHGETFKGFGVPLPVGHVILRAASDVRGREWLSSVELVLKHSLDYFTQSSAAHANLKDGVQRTVSNGGETLPSQRMRSESDSVGPVESPTETIHRHSAHWNDTDSQEDEDEDGDNDDSRKLGQPMELESQVTESLIETSYALNHQEELGQHGRGLEEKLPEEERSLFWHLLLQVRPGMDLSKVVLPTFILDPRSLLDKLSDYYYHADLISKASQCDSPLERMKGIVVWYLSGFYKKPKGVKKPYNPILGEVFRCVWDHRDEANSRTFYIAEQVSHHPPVTAFHVSNRQAGFTISGAVLTKSKYKGNSILAILDGTARLKLLNRGEEYIMNMPYLICKGMLFGKLSMDLGGKVTISCPTTGYATELNFSVWLTRTVNPLEGKIKLGNELLATLQGSWDGEIYVTDAKTKAVEMCWKPVPDQRLNRLTVVMDCQQEFESEKLWSGVTAALGTNNQQEATVEKTKLEDNQREQAKERVAKQEIWIPRYFTQDDNGEWVYKHADFRPWDPLLDQYQYENDFVIQTKMRHQVPMINHAETKTNDGSSKPAPRNASHSRRRQQQVDSDTSSGGSVAVSKVPKSAIPPPQAPPYYGSSNLPSNWETSTLPVIQAIYRQQGVLLTEVQNLRPTLQKIVFQNNIEKRVEALSRRLEIFLWIAVCMGAASFLLLLFRLSS